MERLLIDFLCFSCAILVSTVATPMAILAAKRFGIMDAPGPRKIHRQSIARTGGLAIAFSTLAVGSIFFCLASPASVGDPTSHVAFIGLIVSCTSVFCIGFVDDLVSISPKYKLVGLLASALTLCGSGIRIDNLIINSHVVLQFGLWAWPVTVIWLIAVTVSINFIDGLDGLAAGIAGITCIVLAIGAFSVKAHLTTMMSLALLGSLIGFLFFNFNPARIFMGDSGSMFTGFTLAALGLVCAGESGATTGVLLPMLTLSIPLMDTLLTFVRRGVLERRSLFAAERGHIHHRLLDTGLCQRHVVLLLYAVTLAAGGIALLVHFGQGWAKMASLALYVPLLLGLFRAAGSLRGRETLTAIRRNRAMGRETDRLRHAVDDSSLHFRNVRTFDEWWRESCSAAEKLGLVRLTLPLINRDGSQRILRWSHEEILHPGAEVLRATLPVAQRRAEAPLQAEVEVAVQFAGLESAAQRLTMFSRLMTEYNVAALPTDMVATKNPDSKIGDQSVNNEGELVLSPLPSDIRVAIVHDFLYTYGGAERVLEQMIKLFPNADIFSLFDFLPANQRAFIGEKRVTTTFIQRLPFASRKHRLFLPLMPMAIEQLDVSKYDVVITSSYLAAKGVLTRPDQLHICYCHSPVRFAWDLQPQYLGKASMKFGLRSIIARLILHYIRMWDIRSANGVDLFLCNSNYVGRRIEKCYRRSSVAVYPPVDVDRFTLCYEKQGFYLTASRLVSYKRIDLIVEAFNRTPNRGLIVIGEGPELEKIRAMAKPNVRVLGHQPFERLRYYLQHARAFVFAAEEDFGIAPIEAQACGTPVIAFGRGGVTESVVDGVTGIFFPEQTAESIVRAVTQFEAREDWDCDAIRAHAERFSPAHFRDQLASIIRRVWVVYRSDAFRRKSPDRFTGKDVDPLTFAAADPAAVPKSKNHYLIEKTVRLADHLDDISEISA